MKTIVKLFIIIFLFFFNQICLISQDNDSPINGLNLHYFDNMELKEPAKILKSRRIDYNWTEKGPFGKTTYFSVRWTGKIKSQYTDLYTFYTVSDDGVRLWIDKKLIIDNWTLHAPTEDKGSIKLRKNRLYDIKLEFFQKRSAAIIQLYWESKHVKKQIIPAMVFSSPRFQAPDPIERFAYTEILVKVVDSNNKPVPGAKIYGYNNDIPVFFPRLLPADYRYTIWEKNRLGTTDTYGEITGIIPPGRWAFLALKTGEDNRIIACFSGYNPIPGNNTVILRPSSQGIIKPQNESNSLVHTKVFIKPEHLPVYIETPINNTKTLQLSINTSHKIAIWTMGSINKDKFIINWNLLTLQENNKIIKLNSLRTVTISGNKKKSLLDVIVPREPGLSNTFDIHDVQTIYFSPGIYNLNYSRNVKNVFTKFHYQMYNMQNRNCSIKFDNHLDYGILAHAGTDRYYKVSKDKINIRLLLVDTNNHIVSRIYNHEENLIQVTGKLRVNKKSHSINDDHSSPLLFSVAGSDDDVMQGTFHFDLPFSSMDSIMVTREFDVEVVSKHFRTQVPPVIKDTTARLFTGLDSVEDRIIQLTGTKKKVPVTDIRIYAALGAGSATHDGSLINIGISNLHFSAIQPVNGIFTHELTHNFGLIHGGIMELIDEGSKLYSTMYVTPTLYNWDFLDLMNGYKIEGKNPDHFNKGLYFYIYCQEGPELIKFLYENDYKMRNEMKLSGFSPWESSVALLSWYTNKDISDIALKLGFTDSKIQYNKAVAVMTALKDPALANYKIHLPGFPDFSETAFNGTSLTGKLFITCNGDYVLYKNGKEISREYDKLISVSPQIELTGSDILTIQIYSKFVYRTFKMIFISSDNQYQISFPLAVFHLTKNNTPGANDIQQSQDKPVIKKAHQEIVDKWNYLGLPELGSDWIWGPKKDKTYFYSLVIKKEMFKKFDNY